MSFKAIKRLAASVCCAAVAAASLTSCGDTTYICRSGDKSVNAGVYIYYVLSRLNSQAYSYYTTNGTASQDIINEKYGDGTMTVGEFSQTDSYSMCERLITAQLKFDEMGLSFTDEEKQQIEDTVESNWDADYYESMGISKDSLDQIQTGIAMLDKIFHAYYGEDGEAAVSDSEINTFLTDNYVRFKLISVEKTEGKESQAKATAEDYAKRAEEKSFDEVIKEYQEEHSDDESGADTSDGSEEQDTDNNIMINKNSSSYSSNQVVKYIDNSMQNGEIKTYEDDNYWYVIQKLDVLSYGDYVKDNRDSLISEMKSEDFEEVIKGWTDSYQIIRNDDSYSRYTPKSIYKKYQKYQEKNQ